MGPGGTLAHSQQSLEPEGRGKGAKAASPSSLHGGLGAPPSPRPRRGPPGTRPSVLHVSPPGRASGSQERTLQPPGPARLAAGAARRAARTAGPSPSGPRRPRRHLGLPVRVPAPAPGSLTAAAARVPLQPQPAEPGPSAGTAAPPRGRASPGPAPPALGEEGLGPGPPGLGRPAHAPRPTPEPASPARSSSSAGLPCTPACPRAAPALGTSLPAPRHRAYSARPGRARPSASTSSPSHRIRPHTPLQLRFVLTLPQIGMSSHLPSAVSGTLHLRAPAVPNSPSPRSLACSAPPTSLLSLPHGPLAQFSPYPYRQTFSPYLVGNFKV